jgi:ABC-type Zn uptake system ZnuABC Zn-binding protein ZnuA
MKMEQVRSHLVTLSPFHLAIFQGRTRGRSETMLMRNWRSKRWGVVAPWLVMFCLLSACMAPSVQPTMPSEPHAEKQTAGEHTLVLPPLTPVTLTAGERLRVVATLNLIGDVARQVGGDQIELTTLLPVGADPHNYTPTPADLRALNQAHVILMIGLGLEESLMPVLENSDGSALLVSVNAGVALLEAAEGEHADEADHHEGEEDEHGGVDPHTWTSVRNVQQWVANMEQLFSGLDPANAATYQTSAKQYAAQLDALENELISALARLPETKRKLVTDHKVFGYFAAHYGFQVIGAVIPGMSTLAEPSAQELAALHDQIQQEGVTAIFVGASVSPSVAEQLAADLGIQVVTLYTESLSAADGPAATYVDFMRYNVAAIVAALNR